MNYFNSILLYFRLAVELGNSEWAICPEAGQQGTGSLKPEPELGTRLANPGFRFAAPGPSAEFRSPPTGAAAV